MTEGTCFCHSCGTQLPNRANFCGSCGTAKAGTPPQSSNTAKTSASRNGWGWSIAVVLSLCVIAFVRSQSEKEPQPQLPAVAQPREQFTVQWFSQAMTKIIEDRVNAPGNNFGKHIESIHATVTFKGARVKTIKVITRDGSNFAGKKGENVAEIDFVVTALWDGVFQKGGFTEIRLIYDPQTDQNKKVEYLASNASFNAETVDWFKVGMTLGTFLAL